MSKKKLIIAAAAGLFSFAGTFVFAWLTCSRPADKPETPPQPPVAGAPSEPERPPEAALAAAGDSASGSMTKTMTEQQLKSLIQDIREKMQEYDNRLQALTVRERRFQMAQDVLKKDVESLNSLRTELASTVAAIKSERERLLKSRLEIDQAERANLATIAATYDKMDASSAGKILTNMCVTPGGGTPQTAGDSTSYTTLDDATKILFYMTERTKAKLLAELATSEPQLAAVLSQRLKQIVEKQ